MMAIGMDFLGKRARQDGIGRCACGQQRSMPFWKMRLEFPGEIAVVFSQLQGEQGCGRGEGSGYFWPAGDRGDRLELIEDVRAGQAIRQMLAHVIRLAHRAHGRGKKVGQADAHVRHRGYHRRAQLGRECAHVDEPALGARLVHAVQREHHGFAQLHQFQCQFKIALQRRGIHYHQQQIRGGEGLFGLVRFVPGRYPASGRPTADISAPPR